MKRLILAAGLFAATLTASLHAQPMNLQANIPFDFRIGNSAFPSGEYSIRHSGGVLFVQQTTGSHRAGAFLTVGGDRPAGSSAAGTLQFNQYGSTYYLSKVWPAGSKEAQSPPMTSHEKELARQI